MATAVEKKNDEDFEVLDLTDKGWLQDLTKGSVTKQLLVGSASGWCVGYVSSRAGKAAAAGLGGSLLILQVLHHKGYISVNWKKFEKDIGAAKKQINKAGNTYLPGIFGEAEDFLKKNMFLVGGFTAGFFLGLAT